MLIDFLLLVAELPLYIYYENLKLWLRFPEINIKFNEYALNYI